MTIPATRRSGCTHGRRYQALLTTAVAVLLVIMALVLQLTEGRRITKRIHPRHQQRRRREKKSRAGVGRDFSEFFYIISGIITCIMAPVLISFVHSLHTDPGVPKLTRTAWSVLKKKLLSYLGQRENDSPPSSTIGHLPVDDDSSISGIRRAERYNLGTTPEGNDETNDSSELHHEFHAPLLHPKRSVTREYHRHVSFGDLMDDNNLYRVGSPTSYPTSHHVMERLDDLGNGSYLSTTSRPQDDENRVAHESLGELPMQKGGIWGIPLPSYKTKIDPERPGGGGGAGRGGWDPIGGDSEPLTGRSCTQEATIAQEGIYREGIRSKRSRTTANNFARRRTERSHEKRDPGIDD